MMIGLAASIAIVVFLVCIVFIVYALRSRATRSHISILSLIILLLIGSSLGVYASVGRFSDWERAQADNTKDHRLAAKITQARRVAMNKPRSVEARRDLAGLYMQGGLFGESAKTLDEALTITGPNAGLYGDKARALYYRDHRQMTPEVKLTLEKALSLNPTEASSRMLLAEHAFRNKDYAAAISEWETIIKAHSAPEREAAIQRAIANAREKLAQSK